MTAIPAALLHATIDLLTEVETAARPADAVTSDWLRSRRDLDDAARGAVLEQLYALMRHRARLGWWLARNGHADTPRNRVQVWQDRAGAMDHPDMPEDIRLECPDWAAAPMRARFGAGFGAELAAMLVPPPLDLRVNPMKSTREAMLRDLQRLGIAATPIALSPLGIRVQERLSLTRLPGLKTGEIEIQDEGSQLVAALVDAKPGDRVVDFCAGAGGKTLALAAQMQNRGHIIACDVNEARLKRAAERLRRAGLHNVETRVLASETDRWVKRHKAGFDRVLIDVPCSGSGTWRRNPDARWRAPDLGLAGLMALQSRILASAARLVKPGGRLVYATCSVLNDENEAQIAAFLAAQPGFHLLPQDRADFLSLTPAQHGTDGFFAAVLGRDPS